MDADLLTLLSETLSCVELATAGAMFQACTKLPGGQDTARPRRCEALQVLHSKHKGRACR